MFYTYINKDWNISTTWDINVLPSNIEMIGNMLFEKKEEIKKEIKKEVKEEIKEEVAYSDSELKAKEFLKEKKIRGFWLLKWENLIKKAVEEGFII